MAAIRILLVDDDSTILQALAAKLTASPDVEAFTTSEPGTVVALAKRYQPSLIVCDVDMEPMDGGAVAAALQRDPILATIPFVFLTTLVDAEHIARNGGVVGGRRMISKQAPLRSIIERIRVEAGLPEI